MIGRKFSTNSQFSSSSQKTNISIKSEPVGCRRTASVHQINELYSALNDLIITSHDSHRRASSPFTHSSTWSSESNIVRFQRGRALSTEIALEHNRKKTMRSTSSVSSRSCFSELNTKRANTNLSLGLFNEDKRKNENICNKLLSRLRSKNSTGNSEMKKSEKKNIKKQMIDVQQSQTIDDLIDSFTTNFLHERKEKKKKQRLKTLFKQRANSFDTCTNLSLENVSLKLQSWHSTAASVAVSLEDEARSRTESSLGTTELWEEGWNYEDVNMQKTSNFHENISECGKTDNWPICNEDNQDSNLSSNSIKDTKTGKVINNDSLEYTENDLDIFPKNASSRKESLKPLKSDSEMRMSSRKPAMMLKMPAIVHRHSDISSHVSKQLDRKIDQIWYDTNRRLSVKGFEDLVTGRSLSCEQVYRIGEAKLKRELSTRKVQEWLDDLNQNAAKNGTTQLKENSDSSQNEVQNELMDISANKVQSLADKDEETCIEHDQDKTSNVRKPRSRLPSQPLFYVPNVVGDAAYLRMIIHH